MSNRLKNSSRNILFGGLNRAANIVIPFMIRTLIIRYLGEEYLGLNSLFSSILQVLSVAELGLNYAMSASMYSALATNENREVCALLKLYRTSYRVIGTVILATSIAVVPFLPRLISGTPPEGINIYLLYALYIINTVSSYGFWAYKTTLLSACQRADLNDKVRLIAKLIIGVFQFVDIIVFRSIIGYVVLNVLDTIICNIGSAIIAKIRFPQYVCEGELSEDRKEKIKKDLLGLVFQKIGDTVSNSLDTIIISVFLGLQTVAIYGNYNYIISAIIIFITLVYTSITASIGNSIALESTEKNYNDFLTFSYLNTWLVGWCAICLLCLFQNFMEIWMGKKLMFNYFTIVFLVVNFYVSQTRRATLTYKDAIGMWYLDKYKPIVGCIVNLVINVILVRIIGVAGVAISTIISYAFVEIPWETMVLFKNYFKKSVKEYVLITIKLTIQIIIVCIITFFACWHITSGVLGLIVRGLICIVLPNILLVLFNAKNSQFMYSFSLVKRMAMQYLEKR